MKKISKLTTIIFIVLLQTACMPEFYSSGNTSDNPVLQIRSLQAEPETVASGTDTDVVLSWEYNKNVSDKVECIDISTGSVIESGGSLTVNTSDSQMISIECIDEGEATASFINIIAAQAPVISSLKVSPNVMHVSSTGKANLTWDQSGTESDCIINNSAVTGQSYTADAEAGGTFVLTCTNPAGTDTETVSINSFVMADEGVAKTAPASGGTLTWGHVQIDIPSDALYEDTDITVSASDPYEGADHLIHFPLEFEPKGLQFKNPVTITVSYDDSLLTEDVDENNIVITYYDENGWRNVKTSVDTTANTLTFQTSHFSTYAASSNPDADTPPLKTLITDLIRTEEAVAMSPKYAFKYIDDAGTGYEMSSINDRDIVTDIIDTTACDIDGDGKEEFILLRKYNSTIYLIVGVADKTSFTVTDTWSLSELHSYNAQYGDIACGNVASETGEEIIIVSSDNAGNANLTVLSAERNSGSQSHTFVNLQQDDTILKMTDIRGRIKVDVGNLDDDGYLEIAVLGLTYYNSAPHTYHGRESWTPTFIVINGNKNGSFYLEVMRQGSNISSDLLATQFIKDGSIINTNGVIKTYDTYDVLDIVLGNFEDDDNDEIAIVGYNFPSQTIKYLPKSPYNSMLNPGSCNNASLYRESFTDIELVCFGSSVHKAEVYDYSVHSANKLTVKQSLDFPFNYYNNNSRMTPFDEYPLRKGDFNGDGLDEIVSVISGRNSSSPLQSNERRDMWISPMVISPLNNSLAASFKFDDKYNILADYIATDNRTTAEISNNVTFTFNFQSADVDSDGLSELVTLFDEEYSADGVQFTAFKYANRSFSLKKYDKIGSTKAGRSFGYSSLVVGDFDADNTKVSYTGNHKLIDVDPVPLMIIAASPNYLDSDIQTLGSSTLSNSITNSSSDSTFKSYSVSMGYGFKFEVPDVASAEVTASINKSSKTSKKSTVMTGEGTDYETGENDNIVFVGPVIDSYLYEVLSSPKLDNIAASSDGKKYMTINLPHDSHRYQQDLAYYNANNGDAQDIIAEDFLFHTEGLPTSYPTKQSMMNHLPSNNLCSSSNLPPDCYLVSDEMTTPEGNANTGGVTLTLSQSQNFEQTFQVAMSFAANACEGPVCEHLSSTSGTGYGFSFTASKNMTAKGSLGALSNNIDPGTSSTYYNNRLYFANMFLYFGSLSNGNPIQILNYSVNPASD
ncbi:MAG: hypothetical protein C0602_08620 [Denitrovibrio sp.]|nr:MAG: hypothetical protein C0602_08620 [Denitrovibrio sp.]